MSILLSAYYAEGIVFAADKNASISNIASGARHVEPTATKVLAWPLRKAIVGFVGLGRLARLTTDEWMRIFIAETRDCDDIDSLAHALRDRIQHDFDRDYPPPSDTSNHHLVIHLGGYALRSAITTPVMYHIWNHGDIDRQGVYPPSHRRFNIQEDIERDFIEERTRAEYPSAVRDWLTSKVNHGQFQWYNNGAHLPAFNTFKGVIWASLAALQDAGFAPKASGLNRGISFSKMAVEVFASFFTQYFPPEDRSVGGGVDVAVAPWPTSGMPPNNSLEPTRTAGESGN